MGAARPLVAVLGAGSIGCYLGGRLAASGARVTLIGRPRIAEQIATHGLHLSDWLGADLHLAPGQIDYATTPEAARDAALVLVTVKSAGSAEAAAQLSGVLAPGTLVLSFQNGLHNAEVLQAGLPQQTVLTGMVPFNVLARGEGRFHQGTEGVLEAAEHPALAPFLPLFAAAGLPLKLHADMLPVQWAKLLLNLNNAINALAGVPLKEELGQRAFRRCLALAQRETLGLLDAAGIAPAQLTPLKPHWIPTLLGVPDFVFRKLAGKMLAIDPMARSSMWEDLEAGRTTEVDYLNGEVLRLAASLGGSAPVNAALVALIRAAEQGGRRDWSGPELLAKLQAR